LSLNPRAFPQAAERAVANSELRQALHKATVAFTANRHAAMAEIPEGEALRDRAAQVRGHVLKHLDYYLETFEAAATAAGVQVHWAADAKDARRIIAGLCSQAGASLAVKSKSMTSEEVSLNSALTEAGVEPVETDLGEFIVQLAGQTPSHIVAPAIHLTRGDVADLFERRLGLRHLERIEDLALAARQVLRDRFSRAGVGITGANFLVAETGTIVIVENEGNARLTTTLPRVHIALAGIEKVIPALADLHVLLSVLARSASGQRMTAYVNLITGPRRAGEPDGPEAVHVVLLDNGRSRILADDELRETLQCIRCGACLNACPVFRSVGGHAYGTVYSGPIGAIIEPQFQGLPAGQHLPFASSLCGACAEVCPVRIDIPRHLVTLRARLAPRRLGPLGLFGLVIMKFWALAMSSRRAYELASAGLRLALRPWSKGGWIARAPGRLAAWTRYRDFPAPGRRTFLEQWRRGREEV